MAGPVLSLQNLTKRFPGTLAVDAVSFDVAAGEFLTLLGPSGCGKTTILRLVGGFEAADEGTVLLDGRDVTGLPPHKRDVRTVFQQYALFPHLSVDRNVAFGLERAGRPKDEIGERVAEALELVGLGGLGARMPSALSGGQQQRVAIARAVVLEPRVLLLDEPLGALDRKLRERMQGELKDLQRRLRMAFVFVTHDQDEALSMSDRVAVMNAGRVEQIAPPRDVYERPSTAFVADFVGVTNAIEGTVVAFANGVSTVDAAGGRFDVAAQLAPGAPVRLAVRPEKIKLLNEAEPSARVAGVVESTRYLGDTTLVRVLLDAGASWTVSRQNDGAGRTPADGERVGLTWDPSHLVALS